MSVRHHLVSWTTLCSVVLKQDQHLGEMRTTERTENIGLLLPFTAASSSVTRNTARRSVPILADSKTVTEL